VPKYPITSVSLPSPKIEKNNVGIVQIGTEHQASPSGSLLQMAKDVNHILVQVYLDTGAEVNILNEETHQRIGAPTLHPCNIRARMYNGEEAAFLGIGEAIFQRQKHMTTDVFYVTPRGFLNPLSYATIKQLGLYVMDVEADKEQSIQQPLALSVKIDTETLLNNSFPGVFQE
jgi:hypothetical protein